MSLASHPDIRRTLGVIAHPNDRSDTQTHTCIIILQTLRVTANEHVPVNHGGRLEGLAHAGKINVVFVRHREHIDRQSLRLGHDDKEVRPRVIMIERVVGERSNVLPQFFGMDTGFVLTELGEAGLLLELTNVGHQRHNHQLSHNLGGICAPGISVVEVGWSWRLRGVKYRDTSFA